jgi:cell division protein FtsB
VRVELEQERTRLTAVQDEVERLRARVDSLENDSATIERIAREKWGMIRPGERLYRFEDAGSDTLPRARPDSLRRAPDTTTSH